MFAVDPHVPIASALDFLGTLLQPWRQGKGSGLAEPEKGSGHTLLGYLPDTRPARRGSSFTSCLLAAHSLLSQGVGSPSKKRLDIHPLFFCLGFLSTCSRVCFTANKSQYNYTLPLELGHIIGCAWGEQGIGLGVEDVPCFLPRKQSTLSKYSLAHP